MTPFKNALFSVLFTFFAFGDEVRVIRLENNHGLGMFAAANQVLGQIYLFETDQLPNVLGLTIDFDEYGLYYDPIHGSNWWNYYFEPINLGQCNTGIVAFPTKEQYFEAWHQRKTIPRKTAAHLIKTYIHIKPHIQNKIDAFVNLYFQDHYMIGIHYRGTDKAKEAPRISYQTVFEELEKNIPQEKKCAFFIATDELEFLEEAQRRYPDQVVALEALRSTSGGIGIHFANKNNYTLGEEALLDACLLSKCDLLIRTSSNLSLWSTYFNPELPVILLNQRFMRTLEPE